MPLSINCQDLEILLNSLNDGKLDLINEIPKLIKIKRVDEYHVSIHGCKIKVPAVIENHAKSEDLIQGWKVLESSGIPITILSKIFFLNTVYKNNSNKHSGSVTIDEITKVSNKSPDIVVLLSFCYWFNECNKLFKSKNFNVKFQEVKDNLPFDGINNTFMRMLDLKILQDKNIDKKHGLSLINSVILEIQYWLLKIMSFISEFISATLVKYAGFNVSFIQSTNKSKKCDLLIDCYSVEIKTTIDDFRYGTKIDNDLRSEIQGTLTRDKIVNDLGDALQKENIDLVIFNVVSTSLGMGIVKFRNNNALSFPDSMRKAIEYVNQIKGDGKYLIALIYSCYTDDVNSEFRINSFIVKYPLSHDNYGTEKDCLPRECIYI